MTRLQLVDPSTATGKAKDLLDAVKGKLGLVPNMTKVMATSPAVLEAYLGFSGALSGGLLDAKTREQLALLTAQQNHCDYCLSAHTAIGKMVGLNHEQIVASREGHGSNHKTTVLGGRIKPNKDAGATTSVASAEVSICMCKNCGVIR
jgi:AhpD family alkylhydroperoxidase